MTREVITIDIQKTIYDAAILMNEEEKGCLVIKEGNLYVGIVTERDFVRRVVAKKLPLDTKVSEIMSKSLITVDSDASLKEAARLMTSNKIRRLPVVKQNRLVGIVVAADFVRNLGKMSVSEEILTAMGRYPLGVFP